MVGTTVGEVHFVFPVDDLVELLLLLLLLMVRTTVGTIPTTFFINRELLDVLGSLGEFCVLL